MSWAKIDDRANEHEKQLAAGPRACWLWVCGLMYCNRQQRKTGRIPKTVVHSGMLFPALGAKDAKRLLDAGLWHDDGDAYAVHEYERWNSERRPDRPDPTELSAVRAEAGRAGGKRSGEVRRSNLLEANEANSEATCLKQTKQETEANGSSRTAAPAYAHSRALDPPHPTPPQEQTNTTSVLVQQPESPWDPVPLLPPKSPVSLQDRCKRWLVERVTLETNLGEIQTWPEIASMLERIREITSNPRDRVSNSSDPRAALIAERIAEGFEPKQIVQAFESAMADEWYAADVKRRTIPAILKSAAQLDKFLAASESPAAPQINGRPYVVDPNANRYYD